MTEEADRGQGLASDQYYLEPRAATGQTRLPGSPHRLCALRRTHNLRVLRSPPGSQTPITIFPTHSPFQSPHPKILAIDFFNLPVPLIGHPLPAQSVHFQPHSLRTSRLRTHLPIRVFRTITQQDPLIVTDATYLSRSPPLPARSCSPHSALTPGLLACPSRDHPAAHATGSGFSPHFWAILPAYKSSNISRPALPFLTRLARLSHLLGPMSPPLIGSLQPWLLRWRPAAGELRPPARLSWRRSTHGASIVQATNICHRLYPSGSLALDAACRCAALVHSVRSDFVRALLHLPSEHLPG